MKQVQVMIILRQKQIKEKTASGYPYSALVAMYQEKMGTYFILDVIVFLSCHTELFIKGHIASFRITQK